MMVLVDSGVCRGVDVVKFMVLGVNVVFIGWFLMYGLVMVGVLGVVYIIWLLRDEFEMIMVFCGVGIIEEINKYCLWFIV